MPARRAASRCGSRTCWHERRFRAHRHASARTGADPPRRGTARRPNWSTAICGRSATAAPRCCAPSPISCATATGAPTSRRSPISGSTRTEIGSRSATTPNVLAPTGRGCAVRAQIAGAAEELTFTATAIPDGDFETNRCGFCILHPIVGLAGSPVSVEHTDGSVVETGCRNSSIPGSRSRTCGRSRIRCGTA